MNGGKQLKLSSLRFLPLDSKDDSLTATLPYAKEHPALDALHPHVWWDREESQVFGNWPREPGPWVRLCVLPFPTKWRARAILQQSTPNNWLPDPFANTSKLPPSYAQISVMMNCSMIPQYLQVTLDLSSLLEVRESTSLNVVTFYIKNYPCFHHMDWLEIPRKACSSGTTGTPTRSPPWTKKQPAWIDRNVKLVRNKTKIPAQPIPRKPQCAWEISAKYCALGCHTSVCQLVWQTILKAKISEVSYLEARPLYSTDTYF